MALTEEQKKLIELRLKEHSHARYEVDVVLDENDLLKGVVVYPNVHRPEKTSALYFARYLFINKDVYRDKEVLDMGCGCGIQGIVMAKFGAKHVTLSDISQNAVDNTKENIQKFSLEGKTTVVWGDLFENVQTTADIIVFNHPFFPAEVNPDIPITTAILDEGKLIHRFLDEAPKYLNKDGVIIMPFFEFAGETNNPGIQGPKRWYNVKEVYTIEVDDENIQKGRFSVYELRKT
jgi:methylase of polypeptide subunit release factors